MLFTLKAGGVQRSELAEEGLMKWVREQVKARIFSPQKLRNLRLIRFQMTAIVLAADRYCQKDNYRRQETKEEENDQGKGDAAAIY